MITLNTQEERLLWSLVYAHQASLHWADNAVEHFRARQPVPMLSPLELAAADLDKLQDKPLPE